jgi:hypothetical protein
MLFLNGVCNSRGGGQLAADWRIVAAAKSVSAYSLGFLGVRSSFWIAAFSPSQQPSAK